MGGVFVFGRLALPCVAMIMPGTRIGAVGDKDIFMNFVHFTENKYLSVLSHISGAFQWHSGNCMWKMLYQTNINFNICVLLKCVRKSTFICNENIQLHNKRPMGFDFADIMACLNRSSCYASLVQTGSSCLKSLMPGM